MSGLDQHPEFREPWQAQVLATAFGLQESGVITAAEWSNALGAAIERAQAAGDPDEGDTYYDHVLDALETLLREEDLVPAEELSARTAQWREAYLSTPHGHPVTLTGAGESTSAGRGRRID